MAEQPERDSSFAPTGVAGLDTILHGGLPRGEMHLLMGSAGSGKTTLALAFLMESARRGEPCIYVTLSQSRATLERIARSHGWSLDGVAVHELGTATLAEHLAARQTVLAARDVELHEVVRGLADLVASTKPRRVVLDSISVVRLLAGGRERYQFEVAALGRLFTEGGCTAVFVSDSPAEGSPRMEVDFHPLAGCIIHLEQEGRPYGDVRRKLRVVKARGLPHNGGFHDFKVLTGRIEVYPRLGAYNLPEYTDYRQVSSGVPALDGMTGGGLERGTSCLIVGPSGTGKSTLATLYAVAAGGAAGIFLFDERPATYLARSDAFGIPLRGHVEAGRAELRQVDPGNTAPGEFAQQVRALVEAKGVTMVAIDSVVGYFNAMGAADVLITQLHELITYLNRKGVLTILCGSQESFMSIGEMQAVDISYLSDTVIALGSFERDGDIRRCLTVAKKKYGGCDSTIREYTVAPGSVAVGDRPLTGYRNLFVPMAVPDWAGYGEGKSRGRG